MPSSQSVALGDSPMTIPRKNTSMASYEVGQKGKIKPMALP
jgi:hypothetical protein